MLSAARSTPRNAILPLHRPYRPDRTRHCNTCPDAAISSIWTSKEGRSLNAKTPAPRSLKRSAIANSTPKPANGVSATSRLRACRHRHNARRMKFARIELTMQRTGRATEIEYGSISPRSDLSPASNIASDASRWNSSKKSAPADAPTVFLPIASVLAQPSL